MSFQKSKIVFGGVAPRRPLDLLSGSASAPTYKQLPKLLSIASDRNRFHANNSMMEKVLHYI